jgi:hypothetical protein
MLSAEWVFSPGRPKAANSLVVSVGDDPPVDIRRLERANVI